LRNWNRKPFLIGAQYKPLAGYAGVADGDVESRFEGLIDHVVIWNRYLADKEVGELYDMNMEIDVGGASRVQIGIRNITISCDCIKKRFP
jgi:hypothetical protein